LAVAVAVAVVGGLGLTLRGVGFLRDSRGGGSGAFGKSVIAAIIVIVRTLLTRSALSGGLLVFGKGVAACIEERGIMLVLAVELLVAAVVGIIWLEGKR
jgi:hypothetical protein